MVSGLRVSEFRVSEFRVSSLGLRLFDVLAKLSTPLAHHRTGKGGAVKGLGLRFCSNMVDHLL